MTATSQRGPSAATPAAPPTSAPACLDTWETDATAQVGLTCGEKEDTHTDTCRCCGRCVVFPTAFVHD